MENPKQQLVERLRTANNVLVSVSTNPSVDQLAAAIGLTLMLNKLGKHGTAVFSGQVPSILEFLQPEKTLEKNTDSLRDFIIALDKSKADKLRYKVEDNFVRIFITPYRTSITEKDLEFSQGDFNVEVVVALGVHDQKDLDRAITAHGRILHDATTFSLTTNQHSSLGSVNWSDASASSLCEMVAGLADQFQGEVLDGQIATALLTGIIAETKRFSNQKTSALTMSLSAALMSAGANQQLVASKLEEPKPEPAKAPAKNQHKPAKQAEKESDKEEKPDDGSLQIEHEADKKPAEHKASEAPKPTPVPIAEQVDETQNDLVIDDDGTIQLPAAEPEAEISGGTSRIDQPPSLGGKLTANTEPEQLDPATDPLGAGQHDTPILSHDDAPIADGLAEDKPLAPAGPQTLTQLEQAVDSPHIDTAEPDAPPAGIGNARDAVSDALSSIGDAAPSPIAGLNAQPLGEDLNPVAPAPFTMPENLVPPATPGTDTTAAPLESPTAPPTVPPPFMPNVPGMGVPQPPVPPAEPQQPPTAPNSNPANPQNPFGLPPA